MKKGTVFAALLMAFLMTISNTVHAQEPQVAYTYNPNPDERVPLYYEPTSDSRLFGEYFNGVNVNVLEHVSNEWAKIQIVTYEGTDGLQMYVEAKYLSDSQVEKTTTMYEVDVDELYMHNSAIEQSTSSGPFGLHEYFELLGVIVPLYAYSNGDEPDRPLSLETSAAHDKVGNITGFLDDLSLLKKGVE